MCIRDSLYTLCTVFYRKGYAICICRVAWSTYDNGWLGMPYSSWLIDAIDFSSISEACDGLARSSPPVNGQGCQGSDMGCLAFFACCRTRNLRKGMSPSCLSNSRHTIFAQRIGCLWGKTTGQNRNASSLAVQFSHSESNMYVSDLAYHRIVIAEWQFEAQGTL